MWAKNKETGGSPNSETDNVRSPGIRKELKGKDELVDLGLS